MAPAFYLNLNPLLCGRRFCRRTGQHNCAYSRTCEFQLRPRSLALPWNVMHWGRLAGPSRPLSNLFRPKNAAGGTRLSASGCHVRALIRWERCCFNVPWEVLNVGGAHSFFWPYSLSRVSEAFTPGRAVVLPSLDSRGKPTTFSRCDSATPRLFGRSACFF